MKHKLNNKGINPNAIKVNDINPIEYYNENCMRDCLIKLEKSRKPICVSPDYSSFTYISNQQDANKEMVVVEGNTLVVKEKNGLNLEVGSVWSPFKILQRFVYKGNYDAAQMYVITEIMGNESLYSRVGTGYHKLIHKIDRFGIDRSELKGWKKDTIVDDFTKAFLSSIPKYDDYVVEPNNDDYEPTIGNNYNVYAEFSHKPCKKMDYDDKRWAWTRNLLMHIFGDHYPLGIVYMQLLYQHPKQALPILVLISQERQTGKSTFIDWLSILFGDNMCLINPSAIGSQFNYAYATKNIIAIEESHFESKQATEKLKSLATQKKITVNAKHVSEYSIPFYGKLVIASNDESKFSKVDSDEIRYWVRQIPTLKGKENHNILADMVNEIPYFLYHLNTLPELDVTKLKSRMYFTAEEIETKALESVKRESRSALHKEILLELKNYGMQNPKVEMFYFSGIDLKNAFFNKNHNYQSHYIIRTLKDDLKLEQVSQAGMRYESIKGGDFIPNGTKDKNGRPYSFKNPYYGVSFDEVVLDDDDLPF